ncbi:InlB B-repeat-containing protein, partial [Bifidobacterium panos]
MVRFSSHDGLGRWLAAIPAAILAALMVLAVAVPSAWAEGDGGDTTATGPSVDFKVNQKTFLGLGSKTEGASYKLEQAEVSGKASSYVVVQVDSGYFIPAAAVPTGATAVDALDNTSAYVAGGSVAANGKYSYITFKSSDGAASIQPADLQTYLRGLTFYTDADENKTQNITVSAVSDTLKIKDSAGNDMNNKVVLYNGHAYTYISESKTWTAAFDAAKKLSFLGSKGHLLTIESAGEHNLIYRSFNNQYGWMGATRMTSEAHAGDDPDTYDATTSQSDADYGQKWYWVTGSSKGRLLWTGPTYPSGKAPDGVYTNWNKATNEPTGSGTVTGCATYGFGTGGQWNDEAASSSFKFYVEFEDFNLNTASASVDPVDVTYSLDARVTTTDTAKRAVKGEDYSATLTASEGSLDSSLVSVKVKNGDDTTTLVSGTDYTFDADGDSGLLTIPAKNVTGAIEITATVGREVKFDLGDDGYGEMKNGTPLSLVVTNGLAVSKGAEYKLPEVNVTDAGTKAGKKFAGWRLSATDEGTSTGSDGGLFSPAAVGNWVVRSNATFTAEYVDEDKVLVRFDYDGGTSTVDGKSWTSEVLSDSKGKTYTTAAVEPTKPGYTFSGWKASPTTVAVPTKDAATGKYTGTYDKDVTFTAQWTPATDTEVTFDKGEHGELKADTPATLVVTTEQAVSKGKGKNGEAYPATNGPTVTPTAGWRFLYWQSSVTDTAGNTVNGAVYQPDEVGAVPAEYGLKFTAVYEALPEVTVTFDYNGGKDADEAEKSTVKGRQNTTAAVPVPTREGYSFKSWVSTPSTVDAPAKEATTVTFVSDAVFTAQWDALPQSVAFDANGGTLDKGVNASLTVNTGERLDSTTEETYVEPTVTAPAGKKFTGWLSIVTKDGEDTEGAIYQPYQIAGLPAEPGLWFKAQYTDLPDAVVTYDYNGGNVDGVTSLTLSGTANGEYTAEDAAKAAKEPTRAGYEFAGWDTIPSGKYVNVKYTAQWTANENTVTFKDGDHGTIAAGETTVYEKVKTGSPVNGKPAAPTADGGYRFTGWLCDEDDRVYSQDTVDKYVVAGTNTGDKAGTVSFTAQYVPESSVQVLYNYAGGLDADNNSSLVLTGRDGQGYTAADKAKVPSALSRTGYTFKGWDKELSETYKSVTYTAVWERTVNTVVFDQGDGTGLDGESTYQVASGDRVPGEPTASPAAGWTFTGWKCDADDLVYGKDGVKGKYLVTGLQDGSAQTVTFTAQYAKNDGATVVFNANGGQVAGQSLLSESGLKGGTYTVPATDSLSCEGYEFAGWTNAAGETVTPSGTYESDGVTVYTAQWTPVSHKLTFDKGSNGTISGTLSYDSVATDAKLSDAGVSAPTATANAGYSFVGWQSDEYGLVTSDQLADLVMPARDVEMTAVWTANALGSVTFVFDGGTDADGNPSRTVTGALGTAYEIPADPTMKGYSFAGWDTIPSGSFDAPSLVVTATWKPAANTVSFDRGSHGSISGTDEYKVTTGARLTGVKAPDVSVDEGWTFVGWQSDQYGLKTADELDDLTMVAGDVTFTAQYAPAAASVVIFAYNGGVDTDGSASKVLTGALGTKYTIPANPTRTGYTFTGWDRNVTGTFDQALLQVNATWKANTYKITYKLDGGTDPKNPSTYTYGVGATLKSPTRSGYTFAGWVDAKGNPVTGIGASDTGDKTLTATWTKNASTDGLNPDGGTIPSDWTGSDGQLPIPTRPGYKFDGWFDEDGNQVTTLKDAVGKNLTAKWTKLDDAFDPAGGKLPSDWTGADGELPTPTLPGYKFDGWYDEDGNLVTTVKDAIGKKLTAHWTKLDDAFDPQGGT